jgi:AAA+ superfamily predicted ATPase
MEFLHNIHRAIQAGFGLLLIETAEESRARKLLDIAAQGLQRRVRTWTETSGEPLRTFLSQGRDDEHELLVLVDPQPHLSDPFVVRALREVGLGIRRGPVILVGSTLTLPQDLEREARAIELPLPTRTELTAMVEALPASARPGWEPAAFARAAAGLTTLEASRAFELARAEENANDALRQVVSLKRRALRVAATLELVEGELALTEVGGLEVLKAWLSARVQAFSPEARAFGLSEPRGMLLCGVQGCGKSLASKATATLLGLPLVRLDFASVFASPSPEKALREGLRVVTALAPVVLWVDEIEKGLGGGTSANSASMLTPTEARVFGAFLTWLQERVAPVFVAATANEVEHLPPELARRGRFDEIFFVDLPSAQEREDILKLSLAKRGHAGAEMSLGELARTLEHFSGAELDQVVENALFRAFAQRRPLSGSDLRLAAREIVPLATLYEEKIQGLRTWAKTRARRASADRRVLDFFDG